jgi:hypothetical protein
LEAGNFRKRRHAHTRQIRGTEPIRFLL